MQCAKGLGGRDWFKSVEETTAEKMDDKLAVAETQSGSKPGRKSEGAAGGIVANLVAPSAQRSVFFWFQISQKCN